MEKGVGASLLLYQIEGDNFGLAKIKEVPSKRKIKNLE
jgi:hypothetical protein